MNKGSCLCGKIRIEVKSLPQPIACHCIECRKHTGHYEVSSDVPREDISIYGEENVRWYHSSEKVRRGFCENCGSSLFYDPIDKEKVKWIGVSMGLFAKETNTTLEMHVFVDEKGDYYDIKDGLPQKTAAELRG